MHFTVLLSPRQLNADLKSGTLRPPPFPTAALDDVNARIRSNRKEQNTYLEPMHRRGRSDGSGGGDDAKNNVAVDEAVKKRRAGFFGFIRGLLERGVQISPYGADTLRLDDGVSPLTADDYVVLRVIPMAAYMTKQAPLYANRRIITQSLGVIFSVMASALTAFMLIEFIPAVLATAGAVASMAQYWQVELRLLQTNSARSQLHEVGE